MLGHLSISDFLIVSIWGVSFFSIRKALSKALFSSVSKLVKRRIEKQSKKKFADEDKEFHVKETLHAIENLWFSFFYPVFTFWGVTIAKNLPWFSNTDLLFKGMPQKDFMENFELKMYYLGEVGFYIQALFSLIFIDQRMKDFNEHLIHHISTLISLGFSYTCGFQRVGTMILLLHDVTDVFLYSSKFAVEIGYRNVAAPLFAGFMLCYTFLRLMYFPYLIFNMSFNRYSMEMPGHQYWFSYVPETSKHLIDLDKYGACFSGFCISTWRIIILCLVALVGLHLFWYRLALKVLMRSFGKDPKVYDIRKEGVEE